MHFKASNSPIVHGFQAFYYELLRQKERALSAYFSGSIQNNDPSINNNSSIDNDNNSNEEIVYDETKILTTEEDGTIVYSVENKANEIEGMIVSIQKRIISTLNNIIDNFIHNSRLSEKKIDEIKYIMTVLVDEIFINMKWEGSKYWRFSLLEKQLFQSEVAGERFFSLLDQNISNTSQLNNNDCIFVYLMALSLGFKGKFRDMDKGDEFLTWYKDKMYAILHKKSSKLFYPGRSKLIESCYAYTLFQENNNNTLPDIHFWTWCVIGVISLYIVVSYIIWFGITDDILSVIRSLTEQIRRGPIV